MTAMRPDSGLGEWARHVAVERCPSVCIDLGLEGGLQRLVRVIGSEEVGVANEERLFVVVGVDEPAGDAIRPVAAHLSRVGVEHVHTVDSDLYLVVAGVQYVDVRLAEYHEQVALTSVLELIGHASL